MRVTTELYNDEVKQIIANYFGVDISQIGMITVYNHNTGENELGCYINQEKDLEYKIINRD